MPKKLPDKHEISIGFSVCASDYYRCRNTPKGVAKLVKAMLRREADLPPIEEMIVLVTNSETGEQHIS